MEGEQAKTIQIEFWLRVENNNKFICGKTKSRARIEESVLSQYAMEKKGDSWEYILTITYHTDEELDRIIYENILAEADRMADLRYCFIEADVRAIDGSEWSW